MARQPTIQIHLLCPVALDAKTHLETQALKPIRLLDLSMTGLAGDLFFDVPLMVEQYMFGQIEDLHPGSGGVRIIIMVLFLNLGVIGNDVIVTKKALLHWGQARMNRALHIRMAEAAIDRLDPGMQPMAEGDRLGGACARGR